MAALPRHPGCRPSPASSALPLALVMVSACLLAAVVPATAAPPPPGPAAATACGLPRNAGAGAAPAVRQRLADRWRRAEATAKARLLAGLREAEAKATPNQALWDVVSYDLDLVLDPATSHLQGEVDCTAVVTGGPLDSMDLNLTTRLPVSAVTSDGTPAAFTHASGLLTVALDRVYADGDTLRVGVAYGGLATAGGLSWGTYDGQPLISTLSEPYDARTWWPCKDTPADKAETVDLRVTVPDGLIVASNGTLLSETAADGWRTFHWRESYPIATYLVSLAIHPYVVVQAGWEYAPGRTMPVVEYLMQDRAAQTHSALAVTIPLLDLFSEGFGLYPFTQEKYGHACFDWGGGMEHQTLCSIYYGINDNWDFLIAHELAHQWWGDLVTCADFHHIWLNEGFATWSEAYWYERTEGEAAYHDDMDSKVYYGPGTIYVADETDPTAVFDHDLSYDKASWVVHMLRGVLGDADFFACLQAWRQQHGLGSATTEDFQAVCEQVVGRDLGWFFQEWIYGDYFPRYEYSWYALAGDDSTAVNLLIRQVQWNADVFTMPLTMRVLTDRGSFDRRVWNDAETQTCRLTVAGAVQQVALDPDGWVLKAASGGMTGVPPDSPPALLSARPNPFNPTTTLVYEMPAAGTARLTILDPAGRRVRTLVSGRREAGRHREVWDGRDDGRRRLPSGVYLCRLEAGGRRVTRKVTLVE